MRDQKSRADRGRCHHSIFWWIIWNEKNQRTLRHAYLQQLQLAFLTKEDISLFKLVFRKTGSQDREGGFQEFRGRPSYNPNILFFFGHCCFLV